MDYQFVFRLLYDRHIEQENNNSMDENILKSHFTDKYVLNQRYVYNLNKTLVVFSLDPCYGISRPGHHLLNHIIYIHI